MLFVLLAVAGGLAAGFASGGSVRRLEAVRLRRLRLVVAAVVLQLVAAFALTGWSYATALVASLLVALAWLGANPTLAGRGLVGLGLAANAAVIVANGAMPVALGAAMRAGVATGPLVDDPRHAVESRGTSLSLLDDRVPLALPWQPQVLSGGDVLVAAGIGLMVCQAMRSRIPPGATLPPGVPRAAEPLLVPPPGGPSRPRGR